MDPHLIELPRIVIVGNNVIEKLPEVCKELGVRNDILVLADKTTKDIAGNKVIDVLQKSGINAAMDLVHDTTSSEVDRIFAAHRPNMVMGVGGGTVIDVAKMVAYRKDIPFLSIPTAPSHDGISSETATIMGQDGVKNSLKAKPPIGIIADIGILKASPYRLIASGAADVISNYTAVHDWKLAAKAKKEYYSEYAASLALLSSEIVIKSAGMIKDLKERGIRNLMEALVSSGISMSLVGSSRPASGAEHAFSHSLDSMKNRLLKSNDPSSQTFHSLHGEQCGLGSILFSHHQGLEWEHIRDALKKVGAPTTAKDAGIDRELVIKALMEARNIRDRYTILNEKPLDRKAAEELCNITGVC
jgi:glycerol-1-phosphate dehydrogenase [NAD(P)+]